MKYLVSLTSTKFKTILTGITLALGLSLMATPSLALPDLAEDQHVTHSLMSAAVADTIRKKCSSLNARLFVALRKVKDLENYAIGLGYSEAEIKAFVKSKPARARIKEQTIAYLAENGVVNGQEATYCSLGRAEMKKDSLIGKLLWSW